MPLLPSPAARASRAWFNPARRIPLWPRAAGLLAAVVLGVLAGAAIFHALVWLAGLALDAAS